MSLKLLSLSSMYQGSLKLFYLNNPDSKYLSYYDHNKLLLENTTEFAGSYNRNFRKLGLDATCIITNDSFLQNKWKSENNVYSGSNGDLLFGQINAVKPDILWIENLNFLDNEWFDNVKRKIKTIKLIIAYHCAPYNKSLLEKLKNTDLIITCTPGLKESFENEGLKTYLIYHGFDNELLTKVKADAGSLFPEITFSGSLVTGDSFHNARINLIESLLKAKIDLALYVTLENSYRIRAKQMIYFLSELLKKLKLGGFADQFSFFEHGRSPVKSYSDELIKSNHQPLYGIDMYNLFYRSNIVLNLHIGVSGDYAGNMRMFEVTGVGSCLLTDNKKNMKDLFEPGKEVVVYDSPEDCITKVKWLLEHEQERKKIAETGHKRTLEMHTVENRCKSIIEILNRELSEKQ